MFEAGEKSGLCGHAGEALVRFGVFEDIKDLPREGAPEPLCDPVPHFLICNEGERWSSA